MSHVGLLPFGFSGLCDLRGKLFGELESVPGMLERLFAEFMGGQMVPLAVGDGGVGVGMGRKVMELCDSVVRTR